MSDCAAVADVYTGHHSPRHGACCRPAVKAGTDLECGTEQGRRSWLAQAVQENLITEAEIDKRSTRLFRARFRLGMFDPPSSFEYGRISYMRSIRLSIGSSRSRQRESPSFC